ncbi:MAG: polyheme membrane-associated cytochrome C, partial [Chloroflexota bacterium]
SASYPYFFNDLNGNGTVDPEEADRANAYNAYTPKLLKAAFNYQYSQKDPGAYVHNPKYVIQFLIDSIEDLGGDISTYTRPEVPAPAQ